MHMDSLRSILIRPAVDSLLTLQEVAGIVMMIQSSLLRFGKMSGAQMSNTSMRDGNSSPLATLQRGCSMNVVRHPQPICNSIQTGSTETPSVMVHLCQWSVKNTIPDVS